jgi:hypothetical protein
MSLSLLRYAFLPLALVACGDAMTSTPAVLAKINGSVHNDTNLTVTDPSRFRITAVWVGPDKTIPISEDIAASASFPFGFTLDIAQAPPAEALNPVDIGGGASLRFIAELGAYDDANGNGRYDITDPLLGVAPRVRILYLDQKDDLGKVQAVLPGAKLGFNVFIAFDDNQCTHPYYPGVACQAQAIVPLDTPIVLQLASGAKWE